MNKYKFYLCGMTPEKWNAMSDKEKEDFQESLNDLADATFKALDRREKLKKISSEDLLQELIYRKVLEPIDVGIYKEFELKRKYRNRDKPINFDGVMLLHDETQN